MLVLRKINRTNELKEKYPTQFAALAKCLDKHDYRYGDCREQSAALRECWNKDNVKDSASN